MKEKLIAITGDKGGVGKSTLTALTSEWLLHNNYQVTIIDADPNQSTQTWIDKCGEHGRNINSGKLITIVDTAGTSGSSLSKYIRNADLILVPFKAHVADLEVIVAWFLSLKESLQERIFFIPNMVSNTKEQRLGIQELENVINAEGRGKILPSLAERKAVYPILLNGNSTNFFDTKLDVKTKLETTQLFQTILQLLEV
jgi:chromosome partitioning protein